MFNLLAQTNVPGVDTLDRALQTDISTLYAVAFLAIVVALIVLVVVGYAALKIIGNSQSSDGKVMEGLTKTLSEVFGALLFALAWRAERGG